MISSGYLSYLNEKTIPELLRKAKRDDPARYARRTDSKEDWKLYRIGVIELYETDDLVLYFLVKGYRVSVRLIDFKPILDFVLDHYKYKDDIKSAVDYAVRFCYKHNDVDVDCECADFKYRFAYMATKKDYKFGDPEDRPATKRNPKDKVGLCKHIIKILNAPSRWLRPIESALRNYAKSTRK